MLGIHPRLKVIQHFLHNGFSRAVFEKLIRILEHIIQGEAADLANMPKVSRVLHNRLDDPVNYPYLQCDSTARYVTSLIPIVEGGEMKTEGYDTYTRKGLPAGPINNPGLAAIEAAISPSTV